VTAWEAVIGLEIHVQLRTATKMFCRCPNSPGDAPNANVCAVCLAHPGMLPVPNREAIGQALRVGLALGCRIPERSKFDRKNYFYPDSPKAYQISQYDRPLCAEGAFRVPGDEGGFTVGITRAHLEEDAAKTIHVGGEAGRIAGSDASIVDFNRAGTPLLEIVTEPDIRSGEQARRFLTLLRATIIATGASDCDMERGTLRCDANVSIRPVGQEAFGTKCELKNMNSFRFLERGINAEIARQTALLESGDRVRQATMHYDPAADTLTLLRSKEEADDYRYFPEPDLVPLAPSPALLDELRAGLPELPVARIERLRGAYALTGSTAETMALTPGLTEYFEAVAARAGDVRAAANWVMGEFSAHLNATGLEAGSSPVTPDRLAALVALIGDGTLSSTGAKQVFAGLVADPAATAAGLVGSLGLAQVGDADELGAIVAAVLAANPAEVEAFRGGKTQLVGFFTGQVMKASGGRADPKVVQGILRDRLGS
jgi:aspartyl-tRNA(Asn)/glutamyl-tRNA(Gln) amidotransferase subunit B